jgi:hypothetical protein
MHPLDHVFMEPEREIRKEYGGPQALSIMDANIIVIKASFGASNPILKFCFS